MLHLTFEREDHVVRGEWDVIAPGRLLVQLDRQFGEVGLGVLHAIGEPGDVLVGEDGVVSQPFPEQIVALLVRVPWYRPWISHADWRPYTPAEHERTVAWDITHWVSGMCLGQCSCRR